MALATVGGAALGAAFGTLLDGVIAVTRRAIMFKAQLRNLKFTLDNFQQVVDDVEQHENVVFRQVQGLEEFIARMEKGVQLVHKCSKVRPWKLNVFKKPLYTSRLLALDASLKMLLSVLAVHVASDVRARVINMSRVVNQIDANVVAQNPNPNQIRGGCVVPQPPLFTVGFEVPLREVKMKLLKDDVSMLVVTAQGGMGKTTLAKMFCQDKDVKAKFDENIFFVTALRRPNYVIVQELCKQMGSRIPAFQEEATAFNWLQEFLREREQNPLLLVLDDVWPGSESFLDKCNELKRPSYKILVTSRSRFPRFGSPYRLKALKNEEPMALFRHSASVPDGSSDIPEDFAEQIVERCRGVPLALTVVGRSLCGRPIDIWQKTEMECSKGSILDVDNDLLVCLQSSLDALDKKMATVKECFIDLGSFPEDQRIPAVALIDMWAELHGLGLHSIQILHELSDRSLANLVVTRKEKMEADGYYSEHFVTQHGMLRDLAIHQTGQNSIGQGKRLIIDISGNELPRWWIEQKHKPKKTRLLSISTDGSFSGKWDNMQLPKAEILVLNFQTQNYSLPKSVKKMYKLKVLILTHYGFLPAELSDFKLLGSLSNLKRIRLERISIPSISKNSKNSIQLKSLQKMSLFMCSIGQAFSNSSIQILGAFPNLMELNIDYCNDLVELPAKLCDLKRLEKLSITNCHKLSALPEEIGKLDKLEVLRLRSCTNLIELPDSIKNLTKLNFLDISDCFSIKELPEDIGKMSGLRKISMRQCSRLQELPSSVFELQQLEKVICDEETEYLWAPFLSTLTSLRIKVVKEEFNLNWLHHQLQF